MIYHAASLDPWHKVQVIVFMFLMIPVFTLFLLRLLYSISFGLGRSFALAFKQTARETIFRPLRRTSAILIHVPVLIYECVLLISMFWQIPDKFWFDVTCLAMAVFIGLGIFSALAAGFTTPYAYGFWDCVFSLGIRPAKKIIRRYRV